MPRLVYLVLLAALAGPLHAQDATTPNPDLSPSDVVELQLDALQSNDNPEPDAGIARTWTFAHPSNKAVTGPLERFTRMIKGPSYRYLLNHRSHTVEVVERGEKSVRLAVTVVSSTGSIVGYRWRVERVESGEYVGSWMTTAVSSPQAIGDAV